MAKEANLPSDHKRTVQLCSVGSQTCAPEQLAPEGSPSPWLVLTLTTGAWGCEGFSTSVDQWTLLHNAGAGPSNSVLS